MLNLQVLFAFAGCGAISFVMFLILLKQQNNETVTAIKSKDKDGLKQVKQELKAAPLSVQNVLMSKWVAFGGGFYGVMALMTYIVVEFYEVVEFLTSESSVWATITSLGIGDLINFFINSLMNFITAIVWPAYWLKSIHGYSAWVWFVAVYLGYLTGQAIAKYLYEQKTQTQ
jgi:hypothetical protein